MRGDIDAVFGKRRLGTSNVEETAHGVVGVIKILDNIFFVR